MAESQMTGLSSYPVESYKHKEDILRWKQIANLLGERFARDLTRAITVGPLVVNPGSRFTVMVHGHQDGLVISRRFRPFSRKLWLGWSQIDRIVVFPPFLKGQLKKHTDAEVYLDIVGVQHIQIPWMSDFETLVPQSVLVTHRTRR